MAPSPFPRSVRPAGDRRARGRVSGLARALLLAGCALRLTACIPITLSREHVEPATHTDTASADWDPAVGPDVRLEWVHRFKQALRRQGDRIEFVDTERLWNAWFPRREPGGTAPLGEVLAAISATEDLAAKPDDLVILGETSTASALTSSPGLGPFYAEVAQAHDAEAVLIRLEDGGHERTLYRARAEGIEKSGWAPVSVFMFTRFYKTVDAESSALEGLARLVGGDIAAQAAGSTVHVAVLAAQPGHRLDGATTPPGSAATMQPAWDQTVVNCVSGGERQWVEQSRCD